MESQPSTPRDVTTSRSETTQDGEASHDVQDGVIKSDPSSLVDDTFQEQPASKVILLVISSLMSMFLVALDRTIITTAIPEITNEFNSLSDIGWYGSSYLMTCGAFQLLFGKLYSFYHVKSVLLTSILLFEIGSAVCGAAPTSIAFIVGRALAGIGAAGILGGSVVTIVYSVPLRRRPAIQGLLGAVFGFAIILGPLIGGAFTSHVTWRWCFYINLPIGGVAMVVIAYCLKVSDQDTTKLPWMEKVWQLDVLGSLCLVPGVICLVLALQWGGQVDAWNSACIVALLTVMSVLFAAFVAVQILLPKTAMVPPRLFRQRSIVAGLWGMTFVGAGMYIISKNIYFLPVWFQSIKGDSAVESGIRLLPMMIAMLVSSIIFGVTTQKLGYYTPSGIAGAAMMTVGAGLLTKLEVDTGNQMWIGYQILFGFGMGLFTQTPNLATQTVLPTKDMPIGLALNFFGQLIGGAISVPVGENILSTQLLTRLSGVPGFNPALVTSGGATALISALPADLKATVLEAYNGALRDVFRVGLVLSALTVLGAAGLEWKSTRQGGDAETSKVDEEKTVVAVKMSPMKE